MAEVTRSIVHHVNMGNYEWVEFGATVRLASDDYVGTMDLDGAAQDANALLDVLVANDLQEARDTTSFDDEGTYVQSWRKDATTDQSPQASNKASKSSRDRGRGNSSARKVAADPRGR